MREHLVFLLSAPMASFGSYAGHERRGSGLVPLRSAVLGLLGAAIGIERNNKRGQDRLRSYSVAVQAFQRSVTLRDYQTVQTVPTTKARRPTSRRHALARAAGSVNTIITIRDYRCDVLVGAAIWGDGHWKLETLAGCLRRPVYPLYLGRKSCPLAIPLNPRLYVAKDPVEAMAKIEVPEWLRFGRWQDDPHSLFPVHSDPVEGMARPAMSERVPGEPLDRQAWTFHECTVWQLSQSERELERTGGEG